MWYSSQWWASRSVSVSAVIGAPNGWSASANDGPGQGHTARHPSWSMARCPNISKYWVRCRVGAAGSSKVWAKLTPWIGDWVTPRIAGGRLDAERVQDGGHHVDDVRVLGADLAPRLDALRPVHQERVSGPAAVGFPLPPAERGVARPGPPPRVVAEGGRAAQLIDLGQAFLHRLRRVVEELQLVRGAGRTALGSWRRCRTPP